MQNELYTDWLLYGCRIMRGSIHYLSLYALDIACCGEMKDTAGKIKAGESWELPLDTLLTMQDPLVRNIGGFAVESQAMLQALIEINGLNYDEVENFAIEMIEEEKELVPSFSKDDPITAYRNIVETIVDYLENDAIDIELALSEMNSLIATSKRQQAYTLWQKTPGDSNIDLFKIYTDKIYGLTEYVHGVRKKRNVINN